jgi:release factor glutamine methyltransferase
MPTIRAALHDARTRLAPVSESASLDAQMLLCEVLGVDRAYLVAHDDQALSHDQHTRYQALVERCAAGEPLPYVVGHRAFYDREFVVTPAVLIPRPETELLLEDALKYAANAASSGIRAADIGTGSGALAVTFAAHVPQAQVYAVDLSEAALNVAQINATRQGVAERITFLHGDLLEPLIARGITLDVVLANLPYIASDEAHRLPVSRHEPLLALDGGADGLDLVRRLLDQLPQVAAENGTTAWLEIGAGQGAAVLAYARRIGAADLLYDYAGLDRIVRVLVHS